MQKLLAILFLYLATANITAQVDTTLMVEDITISTNRIQETTKESARNIAVYTAEDIRQSTARTLPEVLQFVAGVDIKRRGIHGVQADISMRGGTFNQVLVMINNVKMIDPQTGHHVMSLPINIEDIDRIEVTKGPAARLYGQNAFSGVVNIITKLRKEDKIDVNASATLASFKTIDLAASLRIPNKTVDQLFSFSGSRSDGYRHNTDYTILTGYYASDVNIADQKIQIQGGYTQKKFGANAFYASESATEQYEEVYTGFASIASPFVGSNYVVTPRISWRHNKDHYLYIRDNPSVYENNHVGQVYNAEINSSWYNTLGTLGAGLEYSYQTLTSNNLGDRNRNIAGAFLEQKMSFMDNRFDITPGVFLNYIADDKVRIYPGIDMTYHLNGQSQLFASWNFANRLPTYTNLYYSSPVENGNENLLPEDITAYEVGYKIWRKPIRLMASVYYNDTKNLIDWAKENENQEKWQALNISQISRLGLDLSLGIELDQIIGTYRPLNVQLNYNYMNAESTLANNFVGRYTLGNLNHQFSTLIHAEIYENIVLTGGYRFYDRETLEDYQILDASIAYVGSPVSVKFTVNNILNMSYRETNLTPMPGRWYSLTVSLR